MKIVYDDIMRESYDNTPAGAPGRLDSALQVLRESPGYEFVGARAATEEELLRAHTQDHIDSMKHESDVYHGGRLYRVAIVAAGGAIRTAEIAYAGEPVFGLIRPPGHHASRASCWGFCYFNNMAVALLSLQSKGLIRSALVLDFDLHVGDGTINILGDREEFFIYNPHGRGDDEYLSVVKQVLDRAPSVDIIAASAGFDEYIGCWGHNLSTDAFRRIGRLVYEFAVEKCEGRRFGILEGGYNHEDLGINIRAFCEGLQGY